MTFGEIMLRLAPQGFLRFSQANSFDVIYGGGEANVAISLANFGMPVEFVTRLPNNDIGQSALMELRKHNIGTKYIIEGGERLGLYFLETGAVNRASKVIYDRSNSAMSLIEPGMVDWKNIFKPGFTSKKRGWGLGLSLVLRIIEEIHSGVIIVKTSSLNEGTTFLIKLKQQR